MYAPVLKRGKISNHNQTLQLKRRKNEEQPKPKTSTRKEIMKIRAEINEIEGKKINETKSCFSGKITKTDKLLSGPTKRKEKEDLNF